MLVDPAQLRLVLYPDPVLRQPARPVPAVDDAVRAVADRMIELMHEARGVGLAGPQVGLSWRIFVANWTGHAGDDHVFINPELLQHSRETQARDEGCLSLPEITGEITRPAAVTVRALGRDGKPFEMTADGLPARVWQHETDHLDGVMIIDRMPRVDRMANRRAIRDLEAADA